ncbi:MAG: sugar ABC transporter permease [Ruminococcus sp.]|jgi:multiple sugar transport system permease protein|nr:sugar ABC transporter permease [Ruminococcus sp.]
MATAAQRKLKSISYARYGYYFILPFFIVYFVFQMWPLINTFVVSTTGNIHQQMGRNGSGVTAEEATFEKYVGLNNFEILLFGNSSYEGAGPEDAGVRGENNLADTHSTVFFRDLKTTLILWVGNFIPQILLSLLLAVWFTDAKLKIAGKGFFKVVMYMPNIITAASVAALYLKLFADSADMVGPVNDLLQKTHIVDEGEVIKFVDPNAGSGGVNPSPLYMVMFIQCWMWFGNTMLMLMSGIMGINGSLFEAADVDGANSWQTFTKITLPLLRPIMLYTLVTSMIGGLQMFDIPFIYHAGSYNNPDLETIAIYILKYYDSNGFNSRAGLSGAASVLLFIITSILGAIAFYINRDKDAIAKRKQIKKLIKQKKSKQTKGFQRMGEV